MSDRKDILLDENDDLAINNGDFVVGSSEQQEIRNIFLSHPGEWKENPLVGFGASRFLKSSKNQKYKFKRELRIQLKYDGFENPKFDLSEGLEKIKVEV